MLQRCKISFFCCNITTFFDTIFSFYDGKTPNKIKFSLLLNVTETQTPLEDDNMISMRPPSFSLTGPIIFSLLSFDTLLTSR